MKFNLWRIISIVAVSCLMLVIWYLREVNDAVKQNNALLVAEKMNLEKKVNELYSRKTALESKLVETNNEKNALLNKIDEYQNNIKTFTDEIEQVKKDLAAANEGITKKNGEIASLTKKIEEYETRIASLKEELTLAPETKVKSASAVELAPITVTSKTKKVDGKILDVNKKYGFVVINVGRASGIQEDDTLFVFRNDNMLGKVVVEKADKDVSIAKVLYKSLADTVQRGDTISY